MAHNSRHCVTCRCSRLPKSPNNTASDHIDQRIQALREELKTLSSYRNTLALIHQRLPDEILLKIFHYVLALDSETSTFLVLTRIASVCTHWRTITIEDPTLWTRILHTKNVKPVKCMLERSKSLPLFVRFEFSYRWTLPLDLSSIARRLQRMEVTTDYSTYVEVVLKQLKAVDEWTLLENLSIASNYNAPVQTLMCNTPILSIISLVNITIEYLPSYYFMALRHFKARYERISGVDPNRSPTRWLDLLSAMPNLETLDLDYPLSRHNTALESEERVVPLPSLTNLILQEKTVNGAWLLQHVAIPAKATMDITFYTISENGLETELTILSPVIEHLITSHHYPTPLRALIIHPPPCLDRNNAYLGFSFLSYYTPLWVSKPSVSFKFVYDLISAYNDSLLGAIVACMKSSTSAYHLTELAIESAPRSMFLALQQYEWVETLTIFGALGPWNLKKLLEREREDWVNALSNIHTLVLHGIPFHWIERHELLELLEGTGIRTVRIEMSTGVLREDVDAIREKVGVVTWDGDSGSVNASSTLLVN